MIEICQETDTQCIIKEEWKKVLREYCYKNGIDYPFTAEEDLSYHPGGEAAPYIPAPAPYYGGAGVPQYGPAPGYIPGTLYITPQATDTAIYPGGYAPSIPGPTIATPAADFGDLKKDKKPVPKPAEPSLKKPSESSPAPYSSGGYTLPPPPGELDLPKYGGTSKPADSVKPAPAKKDDSDDDSDDEDLMARLRNLQK